MKYFRLIIIAVAFVAGVTLVITIGLYFYRNREKKQLTEIERRDAPGSFIKLSNGITHYEMAGPDSGQVVVLLNGFSVPYYIWDNTSEFLINHGYRVLRYDYYGRGYSDRPEYVYNQTLYFNQLNQLLLKLHIKTPVILIGLSFGGKLTADFTTQYPNLVKKIILVDPAYESLMPTKPEMLARYYEATHPNERAQGQLTDFKNPEHYPNWVSKYQIQMQYKGFRNALISTGFNYAGEGRQEYTRLNTKHKPILLIWGRDDKTIDFTFSDSVRSVLKSEFFPVDDAAHLPQIEQPEKVNARILEFLKKK